MFAGETKTFFVLCCRSPIASFIVNEHWLSLNVDDKWRVLYHFGTSLSVAVVALALLMPESPVWFRQVRRGYAGTVSTSDAVGFNSDSDNMSSLLGGDIRGGWTGLFSPYHRRSLFTGIVLGVVVALTGVNAVIFYAPQIFDNTG